MSRCLGSPISPAISFRLRWGSLFTTHRQLNPDDLSVVEGIPCTSVARTLVDCAEAMHREELVELFREAQNRGTLDIRAVSASRTRVEWRPSLAMLDEVIDEFGCSLRT